MSAASILKTSIVVESRFGEAGGREFDLLPCKAQIEIVAVTPEQIDIARHA
jgi:ribonuclease VapC